MNKNLKLLLGIILILIGGLFTLDLLDINLISLTGIFRSIELLWPLMISLLGVLMVAKTKTQKNVVITLFLIVFVACTMFYTVTRYPGYRTYMHQYDDGINNFNFFEEY